MGSGYSSSLGVLGAWVFDVEERQYGHAMEGMYKQVVGRGGTLNLNWKHPCEFQIVVLK